MPRLQRYVAEGCPHHITQRGNQCQLIFDDPEDRRVYLRLLQEYCTKHEISILAWCLMTNHMHLLAVPPSAPALAKAMGGTHGDYARYRNVRMAVTGHLWQARYYSCPVDPPGVWQVMAYIERNPVRAGLVDVAEAYRWSSARAHVAGASDPILDTERWRQNYNPQRWREVLRVRRRGDARAPPPGDENGSAVRFQGIRQCSGMVGGATAVAASWRASKGE